MNSLSQAPNLQFALVLASLERFPGLDEAPKSELWCTKKQHNSATVSFLLPLIQRVNQTQRCKIILNLKNDDLVFDEFHSPDSVGDSALVHICRALTNYCKISLCVHFRRMKRVDEDEEPWDWL